MCDLGNESLVRNHGMHFGLVSIGRCLPDIKDVVAPDEDFAKGSVRYTVLELFCVGKLEV